jgi:hypothetical protein
MVCMAKRERGASASLTNLDQKNESIEHMRYFGVMRNLRFSMQKREEVVLDSSLTSGDCNLT